MNEMSPAEQVFFAALEKATPSDRAAYLDEACAGQPDLRARVEKLLAAHPRVGGFLESAQVGDATEAYSADNPSATSLESADVGAATEAYSADNPSVTLDQPSTGPGMVVAGKYKLLQQIGEGGMGTVWMADQTAPIKRRVAVKLIRVDRGNSRTVLARFEAERQAIALMDHPHIAKLLDAGTTDAGQPYFVMELVKGIPLTDFCDTNRLNIHQRLDLFTQICSAVQHAHQKGIIHRDLKPTNVLVENHDGKPVPKVIDFGLAKATSGLQLTEHSLFTAFGSVMGTPLYMAPEQASFNAIDVDTRADVYALGVILYELLTGSTPLTSDTMKRAALDEVLKLVREQEAPTPSSRLSSADALPSVSANRQTEPGKLGRFVKGELDWIVLKALSKERDRRYESANGFARDIERFLAHEPVSAGPPSSAYKLRKFAQRNRGQVIAASLVLVALLAGIAGTTWGLVEAKTQQRRAVTAQRAEAERAEGERLAKVVAEAKTAEAERAKVRAEAGEKLASDRLIEVEAQKKIADQEKQIAQAVRDFLENKLLAQADTTVQANAMLKAGESSSGATLNPTIRELLDRAARQLAPDKIEASFPKQPLTQAEILATIGNAYRGIGEVEQALDFLKRSEALRRQHLGPEHPFTLSSMGNLAGAYAEVGKLDLAQPLFEETVKLGKAKLGTEHPLTLTAMGNLAIEYMSAKRLDKSIPLFEETLKLQKAKLGPDHPTTLNLMGNLAGAYVEVGKLDLALLLFEESLKLSKAKLGPEHPDTLYNMGRLANAYRTARRFDESIPLFEETFKLQKAKLGLDHPTTLIGMNHLALAYSEAGKPDLALPLCEEAFKLSKAKLGPDHPLTLGIMANIANAYEKAGKPDLALPLFEEALKLSRTKYGPEHPFTLGSLHNLALFYFAAKRFDESIPLFEETLRLREATSSPDHPDTLTNMHDLASTYASAGKPDLALPLFERAFKLSTTKLGPDHRLRLIGMNNLANAYRAAKRFDESIPLFEETLKLQKAKLGPEDPTTLRTVDNLTRSYLAVAAKQAWLGQGTELADTCQKVLSVSKGTENVNLAERAAKICSLRPADDKTREAALALARRAVELGEGHQDLVFFQMALGMAEYRSGHDAEADAALVAVSKLGTSRDHISGTSAFYRAMTLFRQGQAAEAQKLAAEAVAKMKPLPADKTHPLVGNANADDLILWLAYKEAKELIQFEATPPPNAKDDKQ